jgi:glucose/arabinose dehydrogenase
MKDLSCFPEVVATWTRRFGFRVAALSLLLAAPATADFPRIRLELISEGELNTPIGMTTAPEGSGRLFFVDQRGKIQIFQNGAVLPTPFLDIESKLVLQRVTGGGQPNFDERGLLGLAFHPDYAVPGALGEGKFYVNYSAPHPGAPGTPTDPIDHMSVLAEYSVSAGDPDVADPASERILITQTEPQFNHNAGQLAFSNRPDERTLLYWTLGDGGGSNDNDAGHTGGSPDKPNGPGVLGNGQDRTKILGKMLRIDVDGNNGPNGQYGIPADNPFAGVGGGFREEIHAYGFRNPWRFSFDDGPGGTGRLFVADVGQGRHEEVNIVESGGNYGWRLKEGFHDFDPASSVPDVPLQDPIAEYAHPGVENGIQIGISVSGGYVYRGSIAALQGKYLFGDWSTAFNAPSGHVLGLEEVSPDVWELTILDVEGGNPIPYFINSFGEDAAGEVYVLGNIFNRPMGVPGGVIFRIGVVPAEELLAELIEDVLNTGLPHGTARSLVAKLEAAGKLLEDQRDSNDAGAAGAVNAFRNALEAQRNKKIPEADADAFAAAAEDILLLLAD